MDQFLLNWVPKLGRERLKNKMAVHGGMSSGYILPGQRGRAMTRHWRTETQTPDEEVFGSLDKLREASRDLFQNTPLAVAALRRCQTNVIGFGLTMQSRINFKKIGMAKEAAREWQRKVEEEWNYWCMKECDARETFDFPEMQSLAFLSELMNGDCFALMPWISRKGKIYEMCVQLIEADNICNPLGKPETVGLAGGVEVNNIGAPVRYWLRTPRNFNQLIDTPLSTGFYEWVPITARGGASGRQNIIHLFRADRIGQRRGIPFLSPVILPLKNLTRLSESELTAAVVASMFTVFIKNAPAGLAEGFVPGQQVTANDKDKAKIYEMGPGSVISLDRDQSIELAKPDRPGGTYEPAFMAFVREIGAALEIPQEQIMLSFQSSYSASKAALQEGWKMFRTRRASFGRKFCQPIYENWLTEAVAKGRIIAPGFLEDPAIKHAYCQAAWMGAGPGQLQPDVETKAAGMRIALGLSTHEKEWTELHGTDWEAGMQALGDEIALMNELKIPAVNVKGVEVTVIPDLPGTQLNQGG